MITDKQTLRAAIASYSHRSTLTTQIDDYFIPLAESRIGRALKSQENHVSVDDLVPTENPFLLPDRFGSIDTVISNQAGGTLALASANSKTINQWPQTGGQPQAYNIRGFNMEIRPGPVGSLRLDYWEQPLLTTDDSTNDVLVRYPQVYLYGALIELAVWAKDFTARDGYIEFFLSEIREVNKAASRSIDGSPSVQRT